MLTNYLAWSLVHSQCSVPATVHDKASADTWSYFVKH